MLRTATARGKAEQADYAAVCARDDSTEARACALKLAPDFGKPGMLHAGLISCSLAQQFLLKGSFE